MPFYSRLHRAMPVDYSKFDQIEDPDAASKVGACALRSILHIQYARLCKIFEDFIILLFEMKCQPFDLFANVSVNVTTSS